MAEYAQSWRKRIRIQQLVGIAKEELGENYSDYAIKKIEEKLDSEMKTRWNLIRITRKDYLERVQKILRKE